MSVTKKPKQLVENMAIDRPFSSAISRRARALARRYELVMWFENGEYYGRGVELPGTGGDGKTPNECVSATMDSFTALLSYMLETGQTLPTPVLNSKSSFKAVKSQNAWV